jgi:hypothetical protein
MAERTEPRGFQGSEEEWRALEAPLRELDSQLNIFALANGMDLLKNAGGRPGRLLQWYRDGLERGLHVEPDGDGPGTVSLWAVAWKDDAGARTEKRSALATATPSGKLKDELKRLLPRGVDAANAFSRDDLRGA